MTQRPRILVITVFVVAVIGGGILAVAVIGVAARQSPRPSRVPPARPRSRAGSPIRPRARPGAYPTGRAPRGPDLDGRTVRCTGPAATTAAGPAAAIVLTQLKLEYDGRSRGPGPHRHLHDQRHRGHRDRAQRRCRRRSARVCFPRTARTWAARTTAEGHWRPTTKKAATFRATLHGDAVQMPWWRSLGRLPGREPSVTVADARFDGTGCPETNGIQAVSSLGPTAGSPSPRTGAGTRSSWELDLLEQAAPGARRWRTRGRPRGSTRRCR